jgi:hypothetical protein
MSINIDPNAAHACYAPSSAHRWTVCTASAEAIAHLGEQEEGEEAKAGTEAHSELERALRGDGVDADHDAAYSVALALSYVKQLPPGRTWIEERVALTAQIWGRLDFGHWYAEGATLTIVDLKQGFVDVSPIENEQLRIYAASLIQQFKLPAQWIRYVIVQPHSIVPGPRVKQWSESTDARWPVDPTWIKPQEPFWLFVPRACAIPAGPKNFVAGEVCKYCPLFGRCPASQDVLLKLNVMLANSGDQVPAAQVKTFMACKKPIEDWFKGLDKAATKLALSGKHVPGMKLVQTVKHRAWKDEAAARATVVAAKGVDALKPPTPAQAEEMGVDIAGLYEQPPGGPALAFESDKRAAWAPKSVEAMFGAVTGVKP